MDVRPSSCYLYLPCRTAQVLAPAELLEGGIRVWLDSKLLKDRGAGLGASRLCKAAFHCILP